MGRIEEYFEQLERQAAGSPVCSESVSMLGDEGVLDGHRRLAAVQRELSRQEAVFAAETARRSARRLGREGLAWKNGHTNTGALLQSVTGSTKTEALSLLATGEMLEATQAADANAALVAEDPDVRIPAEACVRPWFAALADAVTAGMISPDVSASIRRGIGEPTPVKATFGVDPDAHAVTGEALAAALPALIERCRTLDADRAWRVARDVRDELDAAGIRSRAEVARQERFWRVHTRPSGMVGGSFLFDPEDGAMITTLFQNATHPKTKGKGRWVAEDELARRRQIEGDDRSTDQVAADALLTLLRAGAAAPGTGIPLAGNGLVRVIVTDTTASQPHTDHAGRPVARTGFGAIDGTGIAVALEDVDRHLCEGSIDVIFDAEGTPIDIGREQRLFTRRQRIGLITRDGGCRWPGCDQPGEYSEAHHIEHWVRDHGATEIRNGIMLCRRHHLLLHNHHWEIIHDTQHGFLLVPPRTVDVNQTPVPMPAKARIRPDRQPVRLTG